MKARQVVVTARIGAAQGRKGREDSADDGAVLVVGRRRLPVGGQGTQKERCGATRGAGDGFDDDDAGVLRAGAAVG